MNNNEWIPVKQSVPENNGICLCTVQTMLGSELTRYTLVAYYNIKSKCFTISDHSPFGDDIKCRKSNKWKDNRIVSINCDEIPLTYEIIAWKYIEEPYVADGYTGEVPTRGS